MSKKEKIELMVEGGKAVANATVGQTLGPLKINIADVLSKINEKTSSFKGMKVPVKVIVDTTTKEIEIEVGSPPASELIKKEVKIEKGAGEPNKNKIANIAIEQVIKIAKMKQNSMFANNLKAAVKSVIGSCNSMGILVEGKTAVEINPEVNAGKYDNEISTEKTDISPEKAEQLNVQLVEVQNRLKKELEKLAAEEEKVAEVVKEEKPAEGAAAAEPKEETKKEVKEKTKEEVKEKKKEEVKEKKKE